jgi:hypothetical protein
MEPAFEASALLANGSQMGIVILVKCLLNNGALKPGQFTDALKATFNEAEADFERLDYVYLRQLANEVDKAEAHDRQ